MAPSSRPPHPFLFASAVALVVVAAALAPAMPAYARSVSVSNGYRSGGGMRGAPSFMAGETEDMPVGQPTRTGFDRAPPASWKPVIKTPPPHTRYSSKDELPASFDWRRAPMSKYPDVITNFCSPVVTQQAPRVCGSCWAEAATGALSDRYRIATQNTLQVQLSPQILLNYLPSISGGGCLGGSHEVAYSFIHTYGISDTTCAPFLGMDFGFGYMYAKNPAVSSVITHMCHVCDWDADCDWVDADVYDRYSIDEYGTVLGELQMMAEIVERGPITCPIYSDPDSFNFYQGGIITDPGNYTITTHVVTLTGYGITEDGLLPYWIGRNSYGGRWGEGAGGGWFRIARGNNTLAIEQFPCSWGVPAAVDVERALSQAASSM